MVSLAETTFGAQARYIAMYIGKSKGIYICEVDVYIEVGSVRPGRWVDACPDSDVLTTSPSLMTTRVQCPANSYFSSTTTCSTCPAGAGKYCIDSEWVDCDEGCVLSTRDSFHSVHTNTNTRTPTPTRICVNSRQSS
jgi:hypothetical protein